MLFKNLPYFSLLTINLILSIFIILSANSWLLIWVGLELNLLSFIPIISSSNNIETEAIVKYFIIQAVASGIFFIRIISCFVSQEFYYYIIIIIIISLLMKLGAAPCHFWFPIIINSINWINCFILSTIQKLRPLILISIILSRFNIYNIFSLIILNSIVGSLGGINQTQVRPLIAYSSIVHISWLLSLIYLSSNIIVIYLIIYLIILRILFIQFILRRKLSLNQFNFKLFSSSSFSISLFFPLLSLAGLPPLIGFLPKWIAIYFLLERDQNTIIFFLLFGTLIRLFYYLNLFFIIFLNRFKSKINFYNISIIPIIFSITLFSIFIILIINTYYAMIIFNKS